MATEVISIVDPNDSGAPYTADYSSLSAWEAGEQRDLTSADEIAIADCRSYSGDADTTAVVISGWVTDATRYIKVWTDPAEGFRHDGKWSSNAYTLSVSNFINFRLEEGRNVKIYGLQFDTPNISATNQGCLYFRASAGTSSVDIGYCLFRQTAGSNLDYTDGIQAYTTTGGTVNIFNCVFYDFGNTNSGGIVNWDADITFNVFNCTVHNSNMGLGNRGGPINAYNVGCASCTTPFEGSISQTNCSSSSPTFVNESGDDFHLASSDTTWKDQGASDPGNGLYSDDIDGDARIGSWDIGADEYVATGTSGDTVVIGVSLVDDVGSGARSAGLQASGISAAAAAGGSDRSVDIIESATSQASVLGQSLRSGSTVVGAAAAVDTQGVAAEENAGITIVSAAAGAQVFGQSNRAVAIAIGAAPLAQLAGAASRYGATIINAISIVIANGTLATLGTIIDPSIKSMTAQRAFKSMTVQRSLSSKTILRTVKQT